MVAFNFIGTAWVGASKPLMTEVLRDEWGFRGAADYSDYFGGYGYQNADLQGVRAGTRPYAEHGKPVCAYHR